MDLSTNALFVAIAFIASIASGYFLSVAVIAWRQEAAYKKSISIEEGKDKYKKSNSDQYFAERNLYGRIIDLMKRLERKNSKTFHKTRIPRVKEIEKLILLAGLKGKVSPKSFSETKKRLMLLGAVIGFVVGMVFSLELACVLLVVGAVMGSQMPKHALKNRISERACEAERHLPEMLEVMALCMRSGLSIDASISIYSKHFDTMLSHELETCRRKWSSGLELREEALRKLASTYDSVVFGRVVDTIVRSVRFGSSMAASLESDASEARSAFRSSREERIAKAPVKMMIPTGVLILPAMLIMVLGPILLEFIEGGI